MDADDPRLLGRTYGVPFDSVWNAALDLVRGTLPRWYARWWDDDAGVIHALRRSPIGRTSDVVIRIGLDENGQTRVDLRCSFRFRLLGDLGRSSNVVATFCDALDARLSPPSA